MCRSRQTKQIRLETFEPTEILSLILPPSLLSALGIRPARDPQARACTVLMNNLFTEEKGQLPTSVSAVETTSAGEAGSIPHQLHPPAPHLPLPHHPPHSPSIPSSPSVINQGWKGTSSLRCRYSGQPTQRAGVIGAALMTAAQEKNRPGSWASEPARACLHPAPDHTGLRPAHSGSHQPTGTPCAGAQEYFERT